MRSRLFFVSGIILLLSIMMVGCFSGTETATEPIDEENVENGVGEETSEETEETIIDPSEITEFSQSPMLDDQDLPAVEERLPKEPKLVNEFPSELLDYEIGSYGGTLRTITPHVDYDPDIFVMANEPLINTPGILGEEFTPNVLQDYEVSDDQQKFTFYMREGLKWSDGEPVTTEDVRFTVEDIIFNEDLTSIFPVWLRAGAKPDGAPLEFEVLDEYTFTLSFDEPYGGLIARLAIQGWRGYSDLLKPAHYLKQYHADYTPLEELEPWIEEEGFDSGEWENLFDLKDIQNWDLTDPIAIGFPVLYPWMIVSSSDSISEFERNPYYFKVDPEGNQLPYIDSLRSQLVQDVEVLGVEILAGEVDFQRSHTALNQMPLYRENEENGGYRALLNDMHITPSDVHLNLTYEDDVWREVVQDVRFRNALNLALDRDEISEAIYYGFAEPSTIIDSTYDPDEANRILDEMGMEVGSDGFRVGPDGETFTIDFEIGDHSPEFTSLTQLIVEYWRDLRLDVNMRSIDDALWGTRVNANEIQATMIWTHTPLWYMADWGTNIWAPLWHRWYTSGGEEGEEPPEDAKKLFDLMDKVSTSLPEDAIAAIDDLRDEVGEHVWYFVHTENVQQPLIVNENLGNIPEEDSGAMAIATGFSGEQFFFRE